LGQAVKDINNRVRLAVNILKAAIADFKTSGGFVCNLCIRRLILAALCTNGWFSRCAAAPSFTLTQHFPRCKRTQQENRIYRMGSLLPFAAAVQMTALGKVNVFRLFHIDE
jgi:hypothetical protein